MGCEFDSRFGHKVFVVYGLICYTVRMRKDILVDVERIRLWVDEKKSKAFMCRELRCHPETLEGYLLKFGIDYRGQKSSKGRIGNRIHASQYLVKNGKFITSHALKNKLIRDGLKQEICEGCTNLEWLGKKIPLELHHINGDRTDNRLENLLLLCPNCHFFTPNHAGRGKKSYARVVQRLTRRF